MAERCAVIGIGQTKHRESRRDLSLPGLVRDAALRALQDADMTWKDIDSIVLGTAPDMFEGVMMPELWLSDALGAAGKPIFRVHTAGSVGGSTAVVASPPARRLAALPRAALLAPGVDPCLAAAPYSSAAAM